MLSSLLLKHFPSRNVGLCGNERVQLRLDWKSSGPLRFYQVSKCSGISLPISVFLETVYELTWRRSPASFITHTIVAATHHKLYRGRKIIPKICDSPKQFDQLLKLTVARASPLLWNEAPHTPEEPITRLVHSSTARGDSEVYAPTAGDPSGRMTHAMRTTSQSPGIQRLA